MSLLSPWFLLGVALIAGPIVAHLIRRATRDRLTFSSLRFLQPSPPRLDRRSRIQNPWLLALRCLIVALLAFGFARPFLKQDAPVLASSGPARHVVVVLDESASMQRAGLWDAAKARVTTLVASLRPTDRFALLSAGDRIQDVITPAQWLATPPDGRAALVSGILADRQPGWGPTPLDLAAEAALARWEDMTEADQSAARRELVIVSDFTVGARTAGLANLDWPSNAEVLLQDVTPTNAGNASLQWLGWSETPSGGTAARVRVSRSFNAPEALALQWKNAETGAALGDRVAVTLLPGASEIRLVDLPPSAPVSLQLDLTGDAEEFDNHLWLTRSSPRQLALSYLGTDPANDPQSSRFYIQRAITGWKEPAAQFTTDLPPESTTRAVIVVNAPLTGERVTELRRRLEAGCFVLVLLRSPEMVQVAASLAGQTEWNPATPERGDALLGQIDFQHPLFSPFADPAFSDFTRIHFWKPQSFQLPTHSKTRVVARFDDDSPAVTETEVGAGRVITWGGDWSPTSSQWVLSSKFVPWLQALAERASGGTGRATIAEVGDARRLLLADTAAEWRRLGDRAATSTSTELPRVPGLYELSQAGERRRVSLLTPASESDPLVLPLDTWEQLGVPLRLASAKSKSAESSPPLAAAAAELESRQQLWRWMLWLALALLALESFVSFALGRGRQNNSAAAAS